MKTPVNRPQIPKDAPPSLVTPPPQPSLGQTLSKFQKSAKNWDDKHKLNIETDKILDHPAVREALRRTMGKVVERADLIEADRARVLEIDEALALGAKQLAELKEVFDQALLRVKDAGDLLAAANNAAEDAENAMQRVQNELTPLANEKSEKLRRLSQLEES